MIRAAEPEHYAAVARLHTEGIPHGFLSRLGVAFLTELYGSLANHPGACVLVALDGEGHCSGFVAGTVDTRGLFRQVLLRHGYRYLAVLLRPLAQPRNLRAALETAGYGLFGGRRRRPARAAAELLSIVVSPSARRAGTGRALVFEFESFLARQGSAQYKVVTAQSDPKSNAFYQSCGFSLSDSFEHHDCPMNEYLKVM
jgi:ribosomal protein S18 acetylase RimI-like enzyme